MTTEQKIKSGLTQRFKIKAQFYEVVWSSIFIFMAEFARVWWHIWRVCFLCLFWHKVMRRACRTGGVHINQVQGVKSPWWFSLPFSCLSASPGPHRWSFLQSWRFLFLTQCNWVWWGGITVGGLLLKATVIPFWSRSRRHSRACGCRKYRLGKITKSYLLEGLDDLDFIIRWCIRKLRATSHGIRPQMCGMRPPFRL